MLVELSVNEKGEVFSAQILQGHPLLNGAAMIAAMQWRFKPVMLEGKPVPFLATVGLDF